jgi:hypothetical protein
VFERLRAALDAAVAAAGGDPASVARMREAVIEARVAVGRMHDGVRSTEAELVRERKQLSDAERRGRLAGEIGDLETVEVARHFVSRHAEHVAVLEKKLAAQREEVALAEREVAEMTEQLRVAERERISREASGRVAKAQAGLGGAPAAAREDEVLKTTLDRAAREAAADQQLEALKRRMGRRNSS